VSVIYFLLPLAGLFVAGAVVAFFVAARNGQFDDLDTPPLRVLFDDEETLS
jgi:cbb3-type cytochrome oxidase maturation protein